MCLDQFLILNFRKHHVLGLVVLDDVHGAGFEQFVDRGNAAALDFLGG